MIDFFKKNIRRIFSFIGVILFIILLIKIDLLNCVQIISKLNPLFLMITGTLYIFTTFLKILKWKYMVNVIYTTFSMTTASLSYLVGLAFSAFTPAKTGEVLKIFYMDKTGLEYGKSFSIVLADRIIDIFLIFVFGIIGVIALNIMFSIEIIPIWIVILSVIGLMLLTAILFVEKISSAIIKPIIDKFVPKKLEKTVNTLYENYNLGVNIIKQNKIRIIPAIVAGSVSWILPIFYGYTLALAIGINVSILFFVALVPIICIVELAPISISGIGTRDVTLIYLFGIFSIDPESAIIYSLFHLFLFWITCLLGMLLWIKYPIDTPISKDNL